MICDRPATSDNASGDGRNRDRAGQRGSRILELVAYASLMRSHVESRTTVNESAAVAQTAVVAMHATFSDVDRAVLETYADSIWQPVYDLESSSEATALTYGLVAA